MSSIDHATDVNHDRVDTANCGTTYEQLELSDRTQTGVRSKHIFRVDDDRALCGHPSTERHDRIAAPEHVAATPTCSNCRRALLGDGVDYRSTDDLWNTVGGLRDDDVIRLTYADGNSVEAVVTSEDDGDTTTSQRLVSVTTNPETFSILRADDEDVTIAVSEGGDRHARNSIFGDDERPVESVEVIGEHDYLADDDPQERRRLIEAGEQMAATLEREADEMNGEPRLEYLRLINHASALRELSSRLRDGWPLDWLRQKAEWRLDNLSTTDVSDEEDAAKVTGKIAGWTVVLGELNRAERLLGTYDRLCYDARRDGFDDGDRVELDYESPYSGTIVTVSGVASDVSATAFTLELDDGREWGVFEGSVRTTEDSRRRSGKTEAKNGRTIGYIRELRIFTRDEKPELVTDGGTEARQAALTRSRALQVVNYERKRGIECPDCGADVSASKSGHPLPEDAPAEIVHGWRCDDCNNVLPSTAHGETAPGYVGVTVEFRDGTERYIPVPESRLRSGGESE